MEFNRHSSPVVHYYASNFRIFNCVITILYGRYAVGYFMFFWRLFWSRHGKVMLIIVPNDDIVHFGISSCRTVRVRSRTLVDLLISFWLFGLVFLKLLQCDH